MSNSMNICCCKGEKMLQNQWNAGRRKIHNSETKLLLIIIIHRQHCQWTTCNSLLKALKKRNFEYPPEEYSKLLTKLVWYDWKLKNSYMDLEVRFFANYNTACSAKICDRDEKEKYFRNRGCFPYRGTDSHPKDAGSKQDEFHFEWSCERHFLSYYSIHCITWNTI